MSFPSNLIRKLKEALGEDASEALMDWMEANENEWRR